MMKGTTRKAVPRTVGSAQVGEVTAVLEGQLEMERQNIKKARVIKDNYNCAQALKEIMAQAL